MGVSSISKIRGVFSQNYKDEASYTESLNKGELPIFKGYVMTDEDRLRAELIQRIACYGELDFQAFEKRYNIDFKTHFYTALQALQPMLEDGLVNINETLLEVTPKGRLLVRNICMAFDEHIQNTGFTRFSKAI